LKILHIIDDLSPGGAERLLESSLPLIKERGNQVVLMLLEDNQCHYRNKIISNKIPIIISPVNNMRSIRNIFYIKKFIRKEKIDVVHAHLFPVLYWVAFAKFFSREFPITVFTEHGVTNRRRTKKIFKFIENFIYTRFDHITCISTIVRSSLLNWVDKLKNSSTQVSVIENGIDLTYFSSQIKIEKPDIGFDYSNIKFVTMIGRFVDSKDQVTLINSIELLPDNIHLLLVGIGENYESIKKYVQNKSIKHRVQFLGYREDIKEILHISSVVVLSSYKEGFGLAALEGMAMKKPVIGTNIDGLAQVIANKKLLFEVGDYMRLAEIIKELFENENLYRELSRYCYDRSKTYDISNMINKWNDIYKSGETL
jgi:glycosyltransferase involved in cell wall biosynthesis